MRENVALSMCVLVLAKCTLSGIMNGVLPLAFRTLMPSAGQYRSLSVQSNQFHDRLVTYFAGIDPHHGANIK